VALVSRSQNLDFVVMSAGRRSPDEEFLESCTIEGEHGKVKRLLNAGVQVNHANQLGTFGLLLASDRGCLTTVLTLLEAGAKVNQEDRIGETPLMRACVKGHEEVVKLLIAHKARVHLRTRNGRTVLMFAAYGGSHAICSLLLKAGCRLGDFCHNGMRALMYAAEQGRISLVQLFIDHGADVRSLSFGGSSALTFASINGHEQVASLLLLGGGASLVNTQDALGMTPLMHAANLGRDAIVKLFADCSATNLNLRANNRRSAFTLACRKDHFSAASILVLAGCEFELAALEQYGHTRQLQQEVVRERVEGLVRLRGNYLWGRRRSFLLFLYGAKFLILSAHSLSAALLGLSLSDPLPPIDRSTPEANRQYLLMAIFGTMELVRSVAAFL